ncbi:MAG: CBS domain-containing protein [Pirellulaceae bacterium]
MILKDLLRDSGEVFTLTVNDRIRDAMEIMHRQSVGSVVITDEDKVVGIITDRDVALGVTLGAATAESFVGEVMSREVHTIDQSASMFDAARKFREARVQRLPVVDEKDQLVGLISSDDMTAVLARELVNTCSVIEGRLHQAV